MKVTGFIIVLAIMAVATLAFTFAGNEKNPAMPPTEPFHSLSIQALSGKDTIELSDFRGKKILCVNVASECGYTKQYEDLQKLHERYKDSLVIIGFPCNQFGGQEPGQAADIQDFCSKNYGVTFPLTEKIEVKGENTHPVYKWLTQKSKNGVGDYEVSWNFNKFLIDENGHLLGYFPSKVKPFDKELVELIEK
ncbi:MAG TPA: glutathione peroxidase [Bacteroidia bacterium]|nr:glutathione peroxidase [Bacteroidia bacterium]